MQGTHGCHDRPCRHGGLIPARAGSTGKVSRLTIIAAAHPRSRGEHTPLARAIGADIGSSPLARGALTVHQHGRHLVRLIPARAGNTHVPMTRRNSRTAHPRSRGEHCAVLVVALEAAGSSPLARGTHNIPANVGGIVWLIPARAGNTRGS